MGASHWRERREHYLRGRGRLADLIREGYVEVPFTIIAGGRRKQQDSSNPDAPRPNSNSAVRDLRQPAKRGSGAHGSARHGQEIEA